MTNKFLIIILLLIQYSYCYSQEKNLDTLKSHKVEVLTPKKNKYELLDRIKIDTLKREKSFYLLEMSLKKNLLLLEKENLETEKIIFRVFYNEDGMILDKGMDYTPNNNEITFFYAKNSQIMFFMIGSDLKNIYLKKDFQQMLRITQVLEHKVFKDISFSGMKAFTALENLE